MRYDSGAQQDSYPQYQPQPAPAVPGNNERAPLNPPQVAMVQTTEVIFLTQEPVYTRCTACGQFQYTKPKFEAGAFTYLNCMCLAFVLMCCVPFCIDKCKDCVHHCGNCDAYLGRKPACTS